MAKTLHNDVLDAALAEIATGVTITVCSAQPANYAGIAAVALLSVTVTAGLGNGDYTAADDTSGRKVTITAQPSITPDANGTASVLVIDDSTTLLASTNVTSQAVTTAQTWTIPAFKIGIADPV